MKIQQLDNLVKEEASNEKMYKALKNFLLIDPERQIPQLGGVEKQLEEAEAAKTKGDNEVVRGKFETAAKIEIYRRGKEAVRKNIDLAEKFTANEDAEHREIHRTLLSQMDEVMQISADYYAKMTRSAGES